MEMREPISAQASAKSGGEVNRQNTFTRRPIINKTKQKIKGGKIFTTYNAGELMPIFYTAITAGTRINSLTLQKSILRIEVPRVPSMDALTLRLKASFIPMTYIVDGYDQIRAAKSDRLRAAQGLTTELPTVKFDVQEPITNRYYQDYSAWKFKCASFFLPNSVTPNRAFSVLPIRAYTAHRNAFCTNKTYIAPWVEYRSKTVSADEKRAICGEFNANGTPLIDKTVTRGHGWIGFENVRNSYYTNVIPSPNNVSDLATIDRTDPMGDPVTNDDVNAMYAPFNSNTPTDSRVGQQDISRKYAISADGFPYIARHIDWQNQLAEFRRRVADSQLNDWDIIARLGGTAAIQTDRPWLLGEVEIPINYQQATQVAPGGDGQSQLGTAGAFSVTVNGNEEFCNFIELKQDGIIIITAAVQVDKLYEEAIHRFGSITRTEDFINPELAKNEIDVLLDTEVNGTGAATNPVDATLAFKQKYSEWETMPCLVQRDMRSIQLLQSEQPEPMPIVTRPSWHNFISGGKQNGAIVLNPDYFLDSASRIILNRNLLLNTDLTPDDADQITHAIQIGLDVILPNETVTQNRAAQGARLE